ncbi:MAG: hypothetical protein JSU86_15475 [Phycisphaerales bacterium]|nr:MAG: hypothetical protein JSU86_15475 [Phycisphaerales bacterium]
MNARMHGHVRNVICIISTLGASALAMGNPAGIDANLARQYFREARAICDTDAGRLWGVGLYGPMLFVDPESRAIVANQADADGLLREQDGVFVGRLPADKLIANAPTRWAGALWAMIVWPLPQDQRARGRLMAHELWHCVQHDLLGPVQRDLGMPNTSNSHLDTRDGRVFLQLEWRALDAALQKGEPGRRTAVEDALVFRAYRRSLFPDSPAQERALELSEGLAEYTGVRLSTKSDREAMNDCTIALRQGTRRETFVRSFAYSSGPAYSLLLDRAAPDWRKGLTLADDLGDLLRGAMSIVLPTALKAEADQRTKRYNGELLMADEARRDTARQQRLARYRARFVDGPILVIPLTHPSVQFNPGNLQPLGDLGTVYPTMTLADAWGILTVTNGALLNNTWSEVRVTAPKDTTTRPVKGDGWTLELQKDWMLQPGKRTGSYVLARSTAG